MRRRRREFVEVDVLDPGPEAEQRIRVWIAERCLESGAQSLQAVLEMGFVPLPRPGRVVEHFRLTPESRRLAAARLVALVHEDFGGRVEVGGVVVRSDGARYWTEMKP